MIEISMLSIWNLIESLTSINSFQTLTRSPAGLNMLKPLSGEQIFEVSDSDKLGFFHVTL